MQLLLHNTVTPAHLVVQQTKRWFHIKVGQCNNDYEACDKPKLNAQSFANGRSFLVDLF